jgi:hypothetical protein
MTALRRGRGLVGDGRTPNTETRGGRRAQMTTEEALQAFRDAGALLDGHFILAAAAQPAVLPARPGCSKCPS